MTDETRFQPEPMIPHKTGDGLLKQLIKAEDEVETLYAHIRSIIAGIDSGGVTVEGVRASLEGLLPDSPVALDALDADLRTKGLDALADRLKHFRNEGGTT